MTAWRNCVCSVKLGDAINARFPKRDRTSDGTIGDAAHATRSSDHNPWVIVKGTGVVRARDVDVDGIPAAQIVERLRVLGERGDPRLRGGGYLIYNERITTPDFKGWKRYTGSNKHDKHFHVSFTTDPAGFDSAADWDLFETALAPAPPPESKKPGGIVIPVLLPRTPIPVDGLPSEKWEYREETIDLGFVQGWHGRCIVRLAFGHPGGRVFRAHFDTAEGLGTKVQPVPGRSGVWPGEFCEPAHSAKVRWQIEAPSGQTALMLTYAAPGGASLSLEWER